MASATLFMELVKAIGFPAVIFVIWYLYHQSQVKQWDSVSKSNMVFFDRILQERSTQDQRDYELLKEVIEVLRYQGALVSRMETKIDNNQFCPLVKTNTHP